MKTLLEILKLSTDFLQKKMIEQPRRQAEEIIADALGIDRLQLYMQHDRPLIEKEVEECRSRLTRRAKGEPCQYIRGCVDFLNHTFLVSPAVLIPRQETEILTDKVIKELSQLDLQHKNLWDVCCGSGCMGISLKKQLPQLNVVLSDISKDALAVAEENAKHNQVEISLMIGDLLEPYQGKKTHFFLCNPPYVTEKEFEQLDIEVRNYEPKQALVGGVTGLEFYARLSHELPQYLEPGGKAWFEIGTGQGSAILNLFSAPCWQKRRIEKDWAGHDRFFFLEIE